MSQRRAGLLQLAINGELHDAKGNFTYNFGAPKREAIIGADKVHGFKETPAVPKISGEITDRGSLDVASLVNLEGATITLSLANGKVFVLRDAWFAADGDVQTDEANIQVEFHGVSGEEIS